MLARIQEAYRVEHGVYASTLGDLAEQTNDEYGFVSSLDKVLDLSAGLVVDGTATDYRLNARARDRRGTAVVLEGPLRSGLGEAGRSPKAR